LAAEFAKPSGFFAPGRLCVRRFLEGPALEGTS